MVSKVNSAMVNAIVANIVEVETDVSGGLPIVEMSGNLSASVKDGKERIRVAIKKCGFQFPQGRVTINISPADMRKEGTSFELAIACAILSETGELHSGEMKDIVVIGELGLDGNVIGIRGVLLMVLEAKRRGYKACIVPKENYKEASIVEGISIIPVENLTETVELLNKGIDLNKYNCKIDENMFKKKDKKHIDFSDIQGQEYVKKAILTAVSGMHNILIVGPPGAGKTMMASRIPTIMPKLSVEECLELTGIYSVAGKLDTTVGIVSERPFRAPHHSITAKAMTGGGLTIMPGEITLSTKGVLFLDELTKYNSQVLETLREPLENKKIVINRLSGSCEFPVEMMLVAAMNPCRCGYYPDRNRCNCNIYDINRHFGRISKPLLDRLDISVQAAKVSFEELTGGLEGDYGAEGKVNGECGIYKYTSEEMKKIVEDTWAIQEKRFGNKRHNSDMNTEELKKFCKVNTESDRILKKAYDKYDMSARAYHKVLKVARTLADMEKKESIETEHVVEALSYRLKEGGV